MVTNLHSTVSETIVEGRHFIINYKKTVHYTLYVNLLDVFPFAFLSSYIRSEYSERENDNELG